MTHNPCKNVLKVYTNDREILFNVTEFLHADGFGDGNVNTDVKVHSTDERGTVFTFTSVAVMPMDMLNNIHLQHPQVTLLCASKGFDDIVDDPPETQTWGDWNIVNSDEGDGYDDEDALSEMLVDALQSDDPELWTANLAAIFEGGRWEPVSVDVGLYDLVGSGYFDSPSDTPEPSDIQWAASHKARKLTFEAGTPIAFALLNHTTKETETE